MGQSKITLAYDNHHDKAVVSLRFEKDYSIIGKVKSIKGAAWSQSRGFWYIPQSDFNLSEVFDILSPVAFLDYSAIESIHTVLADGIIETNKKGRSNPPIEKKAKPAIDVLYDEKEKTLCLSLPFALKEQFKKLEGAWWHPELMQWPALDTETSDHFKTHVWLRFTAG